MWIVQDFGILKHALEIHDISICLPRALSVAGLQLLAVDRSGEPKAFVPADFGGRGASGDLAVAGRGSGQEDNGAMEVLTFRAQPESCQMLPQEFIVDAGGSTDGYLEIL